MFHILNTNCKDKKETYGFRSLENPPQVRELKDFENDLFNLISNISFRDTKNNFHQQMKTDLDLIKNCDEIIVKADKTQNLYKVPIQTYKKKITENATKDYQKCTRDKVNTVNKDAANIARNLELQDRIDTLSENMAFLTIKDHKNTFPGKVECRLINPAKNHIGSISKRLLDRIIKDLQKMTKSNQWRCTQNVISWFKNIENKEKKTFFKFDIESFYPSIKENLLLEAIRWARTMIQISEEEKDIIIHCRQTFLYTEKDCWKKKENDFDVSMGSLDGAEVCELVGLYLLSKLELLIPQTDIGLYRDDGLAVLQLPGPQIEKLKKNVVKLFKENGLKITTEVNVKTTPFLDIILDLSTESYKPHRKDDKPPLYINMQSNHPAHIKKGLPNMISKRISLLSSSEEIFNMEAPIYNQALKTAGYREKIQYFPDENHRKTRKRCRKVMWFNPPWNDAVKTNVAKKFLSLIDKHFPKGSKFHKHFNRNNVKVSYSCMPNISCIISGMNKKKMNSRETNTMTKMCNCTGGPKECVLDGKCLSKHVIYKATVTSQKEKQDYIGIAANSFKERYTGHKTSFTHEHKSNCTSLSKYIWKLKNNNTKFDISWKIMKQASPYQKETQKCQLCLTEKTFISLADPKKTLNQRNEIISKCRHRDKHLLKHW